MKSLPRLCLALSAVLANAIVAYAQTEARPQPIPATPGFADSQIPIVTPEMAGMPIEQPARRPSGLSAESLPAEIAEAITTPGASSPPLFGPTPVADVGFLMNELNLRRWLDPHGIRTFGWIETSYTAASTGSGLLAVEPRLNRFGNEFLFNEFGLVLQKPLRQDQFDWGFNVRYFAGANAALGQPLGGIDDPPGDPRFSQDFRDLFVSAHLPIITEGGVNVQVGRMNTIIGWNGFLAPYRPFTSSDYQFFYSQDGAFTGFLVELVVDEQLDIWNGMTLGANTFFEKRSANSYCYIGQVNYWTSLEKITRLTASLYTGENAIFAAPGMAGDNDTVVELRVQQNWNELFTQVVQSNMGWSQNTPVGTGSWYGLYTVGILHFDSEIDGIFRAEWFDDVKGTRTGVDTHYVEFTVGANWHPSPYIEIRPEIRTDFAGKPAFGNNNTPKDRNQLTAAIGALVKF